MTSGQDKRIVSIDLGSTWTKGALFEPAGDLWRPVGRAARPSSVADLSVAFDAVRRELDPGGGARTVFSSSARGGLAVAALGIVPELTLKAARLAACSAGARLCGVYSYKLNADELGRLAAARPDIILFSGGTDGGNEEIVRHNAAMLSTLDTDPVILYAGNAKLVPEIREVLAHRRLEICANILPRLDKIEVDEANAAIRRLFLDAIASGKGLDKIERSCGGSEAAPTPGVMFEFCRLLGARSELRNFALLDLGGATTDFYSCGESVQPETGVVFKGIPEPFAARSVEGDLGMRVSAATVFEQLDDADLARYIAAVARDCERLPESAREAEYDRRLAVRCCGEAIARHAGSLETFYSAAGNCRVQRGRNLRKFNVVVGTGGYFAAAGDPGVAAELREYAARQPEKLLPEAPALIPDREYLFIHLANLARLVPEPAVRYAEEYLEQYRV